MTKIKPIIQINNKFNGFTLVRINVNNTIIKELASLELTYNTLSIITIQLNSTWLFPISDFIKIYNNFIYIFHGRLKLLAISLGIKQEKELSLISLIFRHKRFMLTYLFFYNNNVSKATILSSLYLYKHKYHFINFVLHFGPILISNSITLFLSKLQQDKMLPMILKSFRCVFFIINIPLGILIIQDLLFGYITFYNYPTRVFIHISLVSFHYLSLLLFTINRLQYLRSNLFPPLSIYFHKLYLGIIPYSHTLSFSYILITFTFIRQYLISGYIYQTDIQGYLYLVPKVITYLLTFVKNKFKSNSTYRILVVDVAC